MLSWFVDNCQSEGGPELSKKFNDYGYSTGYDYKILKNKILDVLGLKKDFTYKYCLQGCEMESLIDEIDSIYSGKVKKIVFFAKGEESEMDSLFIRVRNSFAHGNYFKKKDYYCLWNETGSDKKSKKLGSFMMLEFEDLEKLVR